MHNVGNNSRWKYDEKKNGNNDAQDNFRAHILLEITHQQHHSTSEGDNVAEKMTCNPHPIP